MSINLVTLKNVLLQNDDQFLTDFLQFHEIKFKSHEKNSFISFVDFIFSKYPQQATPILEGFILGYEIERIGKEFDLLKVCSETILNIEIKSNSTPERILKQQLTNYYYLNPLKENLFIYTY
ncbi:hypothetical protein ERX35_011090, partial [Macrococcus equipercicus]